LATPGSLWVALLRAGEAHQAPAPSPSPHDINLIGSMQCTQVRTATKKAGGTARQRPDTKSRNLGVKLMHNEVM